MQRTQASRRFTAVAAALGLCTLLAGEGFAIDGSIAASAAAREAVPSPPPDWMESGQNESLVLPAISENMLRDAEQLQATLEKEPQFNTVEISEDRSKLIVWWHGPATAKLDRAIAAASHAVTINESVLMPAKLRAALKVVAGANEEVVAAWIPKEGTAVEVSVEVDGTDQIRGRQLLQTRLTEQAGVPVAVTADPGPEAASRQNDINVMGGARAYRLEGTSLAGGCTTGFPVQNSAGSKGMMFAAHCGAVGSKFVRWPNNTGTNVYPYGNNGTVAARSVTYDGAIISTTFNNTGFYTGAWNASTYTALNGASTAPLGLEVCYSGSYSGLVCGNIVDQVGITYSLGGDLTGVVGMRTKQSAAVPAVGNGDSGGPGYTIVNSNGTLKRYAVSIISAIPTNSPQVCQGVPGSATRRCSDTVYATSAVQIASDLGWTFSTLP